MALLASSGETDGAFTKQGWGRFATMSPHQFQAPQREHLKAQNGSEAFLLKFFRLTFVYIFAVNIYGW